MRRCPFPGDIEAEEEKAFILLPGSWLGAVGLLIGEKARKR